MKTEILCERCFRPCLKDAYSLRTQKHHFCSLSCANGYSSHRHPKVKRNRIEVRCVQCGCTFAKVPCEISKSGRDFCSSSCAATYNNLHKTHGTRRSKLEVWLEEQLRILYPDLEILFNAKEAINAELDIHFPSLRLAFELNGIYHYEPIHGQKKLTSIQTNDHRKFAACAEKNISLCVIDVSTFKNFKEAKAQQFLDIVVVLVEQKRQETNGFIS